MTELIIQIKRIYDEPEPSDGFRVLVDRLWPRGISKEKAHIDQWVREIAPSADLRKWYGHDPSKWSKFKALYWEELNNRTETLHELRSNHSHKTLTLLYSSKEIRFNNAAALKEILEKMK